MNIQLPSAPQYNVRTKVQFHSCREVARTVEYTIMNGSLSHIKDYSGLNKV